MKKRYLILSLLLIIFSTSCTSINVEKTNYWDNCNFKRAYERSQEFVNAINNKNPDIIYSMLSNTYRKKIEKDEFIKRYLDDLSYPYISPLYCYLQSIDLHYDVNGTVSTKVASRLIGEKFSFKILYENGDYYFLAFEDIIDNSYRDKFKNKVVKWI